MKRFMFGIAGAAALVGAVLLPHGGALAQGRTFIAIGTGGPTGVYFVVGNSVCRMVHREAAEGRGGRENKIRCAAPSTAGSVYNINNIQTGELDFGVAQSDWQFHAFNGSNRFEGKQLAICAPCFRYTPSRCTSSSAPRRASPVGATSRVSVSTSATQVPVNGRRPSFSLRSTA